MSIPLATAAIVDAAVFSAVAVPVFIASTKLTVSFVLFSKHLYGFAAQALRIHWSTTL